MILYEKIAITKITQNMQKMEFTMVQTRALRIRSDMKRVLLAIGVAIKSISETTIIKYKMNLDVKI